MHLRTRRILTATTALALTTLAITPALAEDPAGEPSRGQTPPVTTPETTPQSGQGAASTDASTTEPPAPQETSSENSSTPPVQTSPRSAAATEVTLNLYNMTDFHGHIEQATKDGKAGSPVTEAGAASIACWVGQKRASDADATFVLLGDNIGASPYTSGILYDNPTIAALNLMHPLASTLGNHELDLGIKEFEKRVTGGTIKDTTTDYVAPTFPYMAANVTGTTALKDPGYQIWTSGSGVRVAFISGIAQDVPLKLMPGAADGLTFNDPISTTNTLAKQLKESDAADVVVAMIDDDAKNTAPKMGRYVDGLMGGDTHVPYDLDQVTGAEGNTLSATASGAFGDAVSNLQITYDTVSKKVTTSSVEITKAPQIADCGQDAAVKEVVDTAVTQADVAGSRVVASGIQGEFHRGVFTDDKGVTTPGSNRGTESTLGDLIADAMRAQVKVAGQPVDIGLINAGGIRADLVPTDGSLTYKGTFAPMPFSNQLGYVTITGADFKEALEQQWKELSTQNSRPMLKLGISSNVSYTYDWTRAAGDRVTSVTISGAPLDLHRTYTIGSVTFLLHGGDDFKALTWGSDVTDLGFLDRDQFNEYLAENSSVIAPRTLKASVGISAPSQFQVVTQDVVAQCGAELGVSEPSTSFDVALRGLSFTEGAGKAQTAKVSVGNASGEASVDNAITDVPVVSTDGAGQATVHIDASQLEAGTHAVSVSTDLGTLVSPGAGVEVEVSVAQCAEPAPVTPVAPATPNPDALAKTGSDAGSVWVLAGVLLLGGAAATVSGRRAHSHK